MEVVGDSVRVETQEQDGLHVAFVGCTHGQLDLIYETIARLEQKHNYTVDLLLCCGDFEAVRDQYDLDMMASPKKYHHFKDFRKYYAGEADAPILTIFIGGNHEASNHLRELYYGGWVAPNIYFLGYSGVVQFGGLRVGGFSGIYKPYDYPKGHIEIPPYDSNTTRSSFHVRKYELWKLSLLRQPIDVLMSHDWPQGVLDYGDKDGLIRSKPHWRKEIEEFGDKGLGCEHYTALMYQLGPRYWLSGHMHCKFEAQIPLMSRSRTTTHFFALDKTVPGCDFLEVIHFPHATGKKTLQYDAEWLAILRSAHSLFPTTLTVRPFPVASKHHAAVDAEQAWVASHILAPEGTTAENTTTTTTSTTTNKLAVPYNFVRDVDPYAPPAPREFKLSPQTETFLARLGLEDSSLSSASRQPPVRSAAGALRQQYRQQATAGSGTGTQQHPQRQQSKPGRGRAQRIDVSGRGGRGGGGRGAGRG
eukprot:TRINITY_DN3372_c1_g1_i1.p1 TRINITY_DN3372_c1_g1~~TRINITY_DN3372_c1_g1_i1.p1  ORF type:complete len:475 (-),score=83.97 TRINITY_DN3372_c1_g1_i1:28-1452(-)